MRQFYFVILESTLLSIYTTLGFALAGVAHLVYQIYLAHNFRIITTATTWPISESSQSTPTIQSLHSDMIVRKYFAWVSDMNYIKWNNLAIINPAKYQGINMQ